MLKIKQGVSIVIALTMALGILGGCSSSKPAANSQPASTVQPTQAPQPTELKVYQGLGKSVNFRNGPGKDKNNVDVYSINYVYADATFDKDGKIINVYVDALEVSTPNYDGESMPHFSGWPGIQGYNITDHASGNVSGVSNNTKDSAAAEVNAWKTKRERGDKYGMNYNNDWYKQMNNYQKFFKGKTIAEIEQWAAKYTSDVNGRPLKESSTNDKDKEKLSKLTDAEKKQLADVVSGATFSLTDAHGNIIAAIKDAFKNKVEVTIPLK